jgi:iron complex outermembrane receptor protein
MFGYPVDVTTGQRVFSDESDVAIASVLVGGTPLLPYSETHHRGADLVVTVPLGAFTLKSISSYSEMEDDWAVDFTAAQLAAPPPTGPFSPVPGTSGFFRHSVAEQDQFSQEFNLTQSNETITSIFGLYYYSEKSEQTIQDYFAGGFFAGVPAYHHLDSNSFAVYGQVGFKLADRWKAIVGGRYTSDEHDFSGNKANSAGVPTDFANIRSYDRFTGKAGLEFDISGDVFSYLTFSQGYKAGAFDPFADADTIAEGQDEELANSLELGLKLVLLDRTLRLNTAFFVTRYDDLVIGAITNQRVVNTNAGATEVKGLETELTWLPIERLRIFGSLSLMDSKWRSLLPGALLTGVSLDDVPPYTFPVKASFGAALDVPLSAGMLQIAASTRYTDEFFVQVAHQGNPLDRVDARSWVDASVTYFSANARHRVSLTGKNLANEQGHYTALNFSTFLFNNTASWSPGEPRSWEISYAFAF